MYLAQERAATYTSMYLIAQTDVLVLVLVRRPSPRPSSFCMSRKGCMGCWFWTCIRLRHAPHPMVNPMRNLSKEIGGAHGITSFQSLPPDTFCYFPCAEPLSLVSSLPVPQLIKHFCRTDNSVDSRR
jgi:hypothetical protein